MEESHIPVYCHPSVAAVCLNCGRSMLSCPSNGCKAYRDALSRVKKAPRRGQRPTSESALVRVNGIVNTLHAWAEITGAANVRAMYMHAYRHGWTMEREIRYRLKRGSKT